MAAMLCGASPTGGLEAVKDGRERELVHLKGGHEHKLVHFNQYK